MSADDRTGRHLEGPSAEQEQAGAQRLTEVLANIEALITAYEAIATLVPSPTSEMGIDDRLTDPLQLCHVVAYSMSVAVDNLKACSAFPRDGGGLMIYQVAQYPVLRSAIEAAAQAVWIPGPMIGELGSFECCKPSPTS